MQERGELGALVDAWRNRRDPRPSYAWISTKVGVKSRSSVKPWLTGQSMPQPEALREIARLIGVSYRTVLDAALLDAGYLEEREYRGNTTPIGIPWTEADTEEVTSVGKGDSAEEPRTPPGTRPPRRKPGPRR